MNIQRSRLTAFMTLTLSVLAMFASLMGLLNRSLYQEVFEVGTISKFLLTGSMAQDIVSIPVGLVLVVLSIVFLRRPGQRTFIAILGLAGYFFYAYGLYAMQGQYTSIYLVYLVIFVLALYSLIFGLTSFEPDGLTVDLLPAMLRKSIIIFLMIILLILVPLWLFLLMADIAKHIPRDTYAVFVLDLGVVFPAFGIIIAQLLRNRPFGNVLAGVALFKILTICLSVAFGEWFQAFYGGFQANYTNIAIFTALTLISVVLIAFYMSHLHKSSHPKNS